MLHYRSVQKSQFLTLENMHFLANCILFDATGDQNIRKYLEKIECMEIIELPIYGLGLLSWKNEKPELIIDKQLCEISIYIYTVIILLTADQI